MPSEANTGLGQIVDCRARISFVAVAAQSMRPQRVDQYEEHVQIRPLRQLSDIIDCPNGSRITLNLNPGPEIDAN